MKPRYGSEQGWAKNIIYGSNGSETNIYRNNNKSLWSLKKKCLVVLVYSTNAD